MAYFGFGWGDYVSVAEKRRRAAREVAALKKRGRSVSPVVIEGRKIATTFWGKSWCDNLERYSDFATRLPRGRSYVRNGSVVDLQIANGEVVAKVSGSELYDVKIAVVPVAAKRWKAICRDCAGAIDSLVELLQGRMAKGVMDRVCSAGDGLFPAPGEIKLSCSCPDWADMCKHVAATLYGVGARLDEAPELLFVLRGVDQSELLAASGQGFAGSTSGTKSAKVLGDGDVAALFGLEMAENADSGDRAPAARPSRQAKTTAVKAAKGASAPKASRRTAGAGGKAEVQVGKRRATARTKPSARR
jgi:uncharacterized Zn finger protein